jgi:hypothetical protein
MIPILVALFGLSGSSASAQGVIFFRNNLTAPQGIDLTLVTSQNPGGTTVFIPQGGVAAFNLLSVGPFTLIAKPRDDSATFTRQGVDLRTVLTGMNGNVVDVRGVFDDDLRFNAVGGFVVERRVAVTYTFPLRLDSRPFHVTAYADDSSVKTWQCRSMPRPVFPAIYSEPMEPMNAPAPAPEYP